MSDAPQSTEAVKVFFVFFSYAHEDKDLCARLQKHFSFLKRENKIAQWYDGEIKAGREWRGEIEERLNSADIILLLISAAFAHSDFCYTIETGRAMERHNAGEAIVVPIILHPCDWRSAPFAKLQALPGGDEAISEWPNIEKALSLVAKGVRDAVKNLIAKRTAKGFSNSSQQRISATPAVQKSRENRQAADTQQYADRYRPDELADKILRYIYRDEGINPVEDLSSQLYVDPLEIEVRLDKLIERGYVNHNPYDLLRGNNEYSLSGDGKEYLLKTPDYKGIPFPTRPAPRVLLYVNAYHPDDLENAILFYMYEEDTSCLLQQIAERFSLNTQEARLRMNRLKAGGYVSQDFVPLQRREQYRLTDEGVEYILWLKP